VACRRPEFQLRVAGGAKLQQVVVAAVVQLEAGDALRVTAIEAFGQAQDRGERPHVPPRGPRQTGEAVVLPLRRRLTMIARHEGDGFDLVRLEAAEIAVLHEIVRMLVMAFVADMDADIVQDRGVLEPFTLAIGQPVNRACLVEEADREARDVL
jgi:hypothetical protein